MTCRRTVVLSVMAAVPRVAEIKGVAESGYRVIINTGPDAAQSVHHFHVHVLGGRAMAEGMVDIRARGGEAWHPATVSAW